MAVNLPATGEVCYGGDTYYESLQCLVQVYNTVFVNRAKLSSYESHTWQSCYYTTMSSFPQLVITCTVLHHYLIYCKLKTRSSLPDYVMHNIQCWWTKFAHSFVTRCRGETIIQKSQTVSKNLKKEKCFTYQINIKLVDCTCIKYALLVTDGTSSKLQDKFLKLVNYNPSLCCN